MKIKTLRGKQNAYDIFPDLEIFKDYVLKLDKNIRYDNKVIKKEIERLYFLIINEDGEISYSLMRGWLIKNYNFKTKKWLTIDYFIERGWFEDDAIIELDKRLAALKQRNPLCVEYWVNKGYTEKEGMKFISETQRKNSKLVKTYPGKSKKILREKGYSEEEITELCLTPANIKFWVKKGYSEEEAKKMVSENAKNASKNVNYSKILSNTKIEYWINKGYSEEEAIILRSERQSTFTLDKCIDKYGKEEGIKRFNERQLKWQKSLSDGGNLKIGYSKISQDLFYDLLESYNNEEKDKIFFATHNKEYVLEKENGGVWLYDFVDTINKKIIEFNGDMYHGNPNKFKAEDNPHPFRKNITAQEIWDKDKRKLDIAIKNGFEVLTIWDSEYRWGNKQEILDKCLVFLNKK